MSRRIIGTLGLLVISLNMVGCKSVIGTSAVDLPLVAQLSEQEVVDYYKEQLSFDTVASRNLDIDEISYETKEVTGELANKLKQLTSEIEGYLNYVTYVGGDEASRLLSESDFNYIKSYLNDMKLVNGSVQGINQALGYYFVDMEYDIESAAIGYPEWSYSLLGLHGAFTQDYTGADTINTVLMTKAAANLNTYYTNNGINKTASYDSSTNNFSMSYNKLSELDFSQSVGSDNINMSERLCPVDTTEVNKIAGSSLAQSAYMPQLSMVYKVPNSSDGISGAGIFPCGAGGLKKFGYDRSQMNGKLTLRFAFKQDTENPESILGAGIYPVQSEIVSGISVDTDNVVVPDFLMTEFEKLIDSSDRAISNCDLAALMSGNLYSDCGPAILRGYESNYVNLLRNMSTIRRVVARDMDSNSYLLEVETLRQEGTKDRDTYGTYRDKSYVVVEQLGNQFIITDKLTLTRQMTKEPSINPDSAVQKRLAALNLAGEVSEENKVEIKELLDDLYKAGTAKVLNGPKETKIDGQKVNLEKGLYDCFNSDTSMLASDKKEYMNSLLRNILTKQGTDVESTYKGTVTQWVGGADNQAELMTEEVVLYGKKGNKGQYMQVYYLVSKMNDTWVIDDMKIIESEEKTGDELQQILNRIG